MVEDKQFEIAYTIQKNTWISPILIGVVNATCSNEAIDVVIDREKDFDVNIISIKEFDQLVEEKNVSNLK